MLVIDEAGLESLEPLEVEVVVTCSRVLAILV